MTWLVSAPLGDWLPWVDGLAKQTGIKEMTYKDKEKQREAVRKAAAKRRVLQKVLQERVLQEGITLSDGQVWYPENPLNRSVVLPKGKVAYTPNGGYIHVKKLVEPSWRKFLLYMAENLNPAYQGSIRIGMNGPTLLEVKPLLEATG